MRPVHYKIGLTPDQIGPILKQATLDNSHVYLVTDTHVNSIYGERITSWIKSGWLRSSTVILAGEPSKSTRMVTDLQTEWFKGGVDRNSCILAFGGGVVGDLAGYASSTILRGIDYIQIPTTLLAMVDSSTGGKTAVDTCYGKNTIGTFHSPKGVYICPSFLDTLSDTEFSMGMAEIIKIALTSNCELWDILSEAGSHPIRNNPEMMYRVIRMAIETKRKIVNCDPTETLSQREVLNFGHTIGLLYIR